MPEPTPEQKRAVIRDFLRQCRTWGTEREIPGALARLAQAPTSADAARLHQWTTWVEFIDHAQHELDEGTLDRWLVGR